MRNFKNATNKLSKTKKRNNHNIENLLKKYPNLKTGTIFSLVTTGLLIASLITSPYTNARQYNETQTTKNDTTIQIDTNYTSIFDKEYQIDTLSDFDQLYDDAISTIQLLILSSEGNVLKQHTCAGQTLIGSGLSTFIKKGTCSDFNCLYNRYEDKNKSVKWVSAGGCGYSKITPDQNLAAMAGYFRLLYNSTYNSWAKLFKGSNLKIGELAAMCSMAYQSPAAGNSLFKYVAAHHDNPIECAKYIVNHLSSYKQRRCLEALFYLNVENICQKAPDLASLTTYRLSTTDCNKMINDLNNGKLDGAITLARKVIEMSEQHKFSSALEDLQKSGLSEERSKILQSSQTKTYPESINEHISVTNKDSTYLISSEKYFLDKKGERKN